MLLLMFSVSDVSAFLSCRYLMVIYSFLLQKYIRLKYSDFHKIPCKNINIQYNRSKSTQHWGIKLQMFIIARLVSCVSGPSACELRDTVSNILKWNVLNFLYFWQHLFQILIPSSWFPIFCFISSLKRTVGPKLRDSFSPHMAVFPQSWRLKLAHSAV